jgi:hypothetical protein
MLLTPYLLYKLMPPTITDTPDAPAAASKRLEVRLPACRHPTPRPAGALTPHLPASRPSLLATAPMQPALQLPPLSPLPAAPPSPRPCRDGPLLAA